MKKILVLALFTVFAAATSFAQQNEVELLKSKYKHEKKEIVSAFMNLSNDDAKKFWPIYDEYEHERGKLATMRIDILTEFAKNYKTLTDEHADKLITGVFEYQKEMTSLRQSYYKKVKKALNARRAASFVQVEEFLESAIRLLIQANVPYIAN
jgi:hypothetical protein